MRNAVGGYHGRPRSQTQIGAGGSRAWSRDCLTPNEPEATTPCPALKQKCGQGRSFMLLSPARWIVWTAVVGCLACTAGSSARDAGASAVTCGDEYQPCCNGSVCNLGLICSAALCQQPGTPEDAGPDAGTSDAGTSDAGVTDGGVDAGTSDDSGVPDDTDAGEQTANGGVGDGGSADGGE